MIALDPRATAMVAIDMHRGHLEPTVAILPLPAERCGPLIARAADLFREARALDVPVVHVVTEYRDAGEIAANPFWKAAPRRRAVASSSTTSSTFRGGRSSRPSWSHRTS